LGQTINIDALVDEQRIGGFNLKLLIWSFLAMFADGCDIGVLSFSLRDLQVLRHVPQSAFGPAADRSQTEPGGVSVP
jgi:AAHS family 4-hydroxybenzoate transporter-like MFS transporter